MNEYETPRAASERLIRLPQVLGLVGVGKTMLYSLMKAGDFPQPRKIRHVSVWLESEVQQWIMSLTSVAR